MTTEWLTREEVAELLKVSKETVYRWTKSGKLPAWKFERAVRYRAEDVEAMAEPVVPDESGHDAAVGPSPTSRE